MSYFNICNNKILFLFLGNARQPSRLMQMIAEAHEIREKQSANRTHVINNVAIKGQNNADDSVSIGFLFNFIELFVYIDRYFKG